jgi:hypothetical protein
MTDSLAVRRWILARLSGNPVLDDLLANAPEGVDSNVFEAPAPEGALCPLISFQHIPGSQDTRFGDNTIAMAEHVFLVKVVVEGNDTAQLGAIDEIMQSLLDEQKGVQDGQWQVDGRRTEPFSNSVFEDGKLHRQAGGRYRFTLRRTF